MQGIQKVHLRAPCFINTAEPNGILYKARTRTRI